MDLQIIQSKIYEIRGYRVMFDFHLAELYQIETKNLKRAVRRNIERFPTPDFMFELTTNEWEDLRCNFGTSNLGGIRYSPFVFTREGVAMLSSVLTSKIAIEMNISIMRAFVALRQYASGLAELNRKLEDFMIESNLQFSEIYQALVELASKKELEDEQRNPIGYKLPLKD